MSYPSHLTFQSRNRGTSDFNGIAPDHTMESSLFQSRNRGTSDFNCNVFETEDMLCGAGFNLVIEELLISTRKT